MTIPWWGYMILAGLSWGTYVPIIFFGGNVLGGMALRRLRLAEDVDDMVARLLETVVA